ISISNLLHERSPETDRSTREGAVGEIWQVQPADHDRNYSRGKVLSRRGIPPEIFGETSRWLHLPRTALIEYAFCKVPPAGATNSRMPEHFDVIIIDTGAGGGTLLHRLAPSGKKILVLERGPFLPREKDNWNYHGSFKYYSSEAMYNRDGGEIRPGFSYYVGGNTKVYGAALFRLRERDFEKFRHKD